MTTNNPELKQRIVDTAINLAEATNWESVRLNDIAEKMDISLDEIRENFGEKEDIIDAWFDRADSDMLKTTETAEFETLDTGRKLHTLLTNWLATLVAHRGVTRQMIIGKLEFGHIHYQLKGLLRVSRTVQWWRDAAGIKSTLTGRAFDETALTAVYLATFIKWMFDTSANSRATSDFLKHQLDLAARIRHLFNHKNHQTRKTPPRASH